MHARAAHSDRTDAGHDFTLGQMPVAHQSPAAITGELVGMAAEHARNLSLDGLRQKRSRAVAQNLSQRIAKVPRCESWKTLVSVTAYHSFAGEVEASNTPTIRRLTPSRRHQLSPIARDRLPNCLVVRL
jgi:hypothetical protein